MLKAKGSTIFTLALLMMFLFTSVVSAADLTNGAAITGNLSESQASLVLKNGVIYTMDDQDRVATAVAVKDDEIIYVGDDSGIKAYLGPQTKVIDLAGKMVAPGFVDGHIHACGEQINKTYKLYLADVEPTIPAYQQALKEFVAKQPETPIVFGTNFQLNAFDKKGPTKEVLDQIVSDRPVIISDTSYHGYWLNTKALERLQITRDTKAPEGGTIVKNAQGAPTGYLVDCDPLVQPLLDQFKITPEQFLEAFQLLEEQSAAKGLTAINSLGTEIDGLTLWKTVDEYAKTGEMTLRTNFSYGMVPGDDVHKAVQALKEGQQYVSSLQNITTIKMFADGVVEGKTAYLLAPYAAEAEMPADYRGEPIWSAKELNETVAAIDRAGFQVHIHAIGDGAANQALNAIEYAFEQNGRRDARHALAHLTIMDQKDIERMGQLGVIAAMQPVWFYKDPLFSALEKQMLGEERFKQMYAIKDMVDAGILITGSSDSPVTPDNRPLIGIETGVTQCSPYSGEQGDEKYLRSADQRVSVKDMLRAYTINGAKEMSMEKIIGSIEKGKKADMVVLEKDITNIKAEDISETAIVHTIFGGKIVYTSIAYVHD